MRELTNEESDERLGVAGKIRLSYWLAVLLIAALASASLWIMDRQIRHKFTDTDLVYLAGEQKMASQRIALLTHTAGNSKRIYIHAAAINELRERISAFERNHAKFREHILNGEGLDETTHGQLTALLTKPPYDVDFFARDTIKKARLFAERSSDPEERANAQPIFNASTSATLAGYTQMSDILAESAESAIARLAAIYRLLFSAMMLVLASTVIFIFRPMIKRVAQRTRELMTARNEMAFLAAHDRLTGIRNRTFLTDHFEHMIENARRREERVGVLHLDLDDFKGINDTYGHMAGDAVLKIVATRIKETVRAADIAARLGGDEFVVLLNAPGEAEDIASVAQRIIDDVNKPIDIDNVIFRCRASVGISIYPEDAARPDDLLIGADLALYQAKEHGRGCVRFFSSDLRHRHEMRRLLEADLRDSLGKGEILVDYQPQISLTDGRITGVEALARWNRNGTELVAPDVFIPVAEKAGLLEPIGRYVMSSAIAQAAAWNRDGISFGRVSINASWSELMRNDFVSFILGQTNAHGLPNGMLSVEIVEGTILQDERVDVAGKLRSLRNAGVFVELDDFGTGYASLTHVSSNEIDRLKIDERFIRDIDTDRNNMKIVRALVDLAHGLDIAIVAEGAETAEEIETLREIGCNDVQGYGIAYPMDARLISEWLVRHRAQKVVPVPADKAARA